MTHEATGPDATARIADDPVTAGLYEHLLQYVQQLGAASAHGTRSSVQLRAAPSGRTFLRVHPRRASLRLTIVTDIRIISTRVVTQDQSSATRWHNDVVVETSGELDAELLGWLEHALAVAARSS